MVGLRLSDKNISKTKFDFEYFPSDFYGECTKSTHTKSTKQEVIYKVYNTESMKSLQNRTNVKADKTEMQIRAYSASFTQMVHPFLPVFLPLLDQQGEFSSSFSRMKLFISQTGRQEAKNARAKSNLCCYRQGDFIHRLFRNHSYLPSGTETDKETPNAAPRALSACRHHPAHHNNPYDQFLHALGVTSHIATYPWFTFSNQNTPHHKATKLHGIESTKFCYETTIVSITHKHSKIPH